MISDSSPDNNESIYTSTNAPQKLKTEFKRFTSTMYIYNLALESGNPPKLWLKVLPLLQYFHSSLD